MSSRFLRSGQRWSTFRAPPTVISEATTTDKEDDGALQDRLEDDDVVTTIPPSGAHIASDARSDQHNHDSFLGLIDETLRMHTLRSSTPTINRANTSPSPPQSVLQQLRFFLPPQYFTPTEMKDYASLIICNGGIVGDLVYDIVLIPENGRHLATTYPKPIDIRAGAVLVLVSDLLESIRRGEINFDHPKRASVSGIVLPAGQATASTGSKRRFMRDASENPPSKRFKLKATFPSHPTRGAKCQDILAKMLAYDWDRPGASIARFLEEQKVLRKQDITSTVRTYELAFALQCEGYRKHKKDFEKLYQQYLASVDTAEDHPSMPPLASRSVRDVSPSSTSGHTTVRGGSIAAPSEAGESVGSASILDLASSSTVYDSDTWDSNGYAAYPAESIKAYGDPDREFESRSSTPCRQTGSDNRPSTPAHTVHVFNDNGPGVASEDCIANASRPVGRSRVTSGGVLPSDGGSNSSTTPGVSPAPMTSLYYAVTADGTAKRPSSDNVAARLIEKAIILPAAVSRSDPLRSSPRGLSLSPAPIASGAHQSSPYGGGVGPPTLDLPPRPPDPSSIQREEASAQESTPPTDPFRSVESLDIPRPLSPLTALRQHSMVRGQAIYPWPVYIDDDLQAGWMYSLRTARIDPERILQALCGYQGRVIFIFAHQRLTAQAAWQIMTLDIVKRRVGIWPPDTAQLSEHQLKQREAFDSMIGTLLFSLGIIKLASFHFVNVAPDIPIELVLEKVVRDASA